MPVVRWVFTDPVTAGSYTVELNPSEGGTPQYRKNINFQVTAGPAGQVLAFEGRDQPREITITGVMKEEAHLNNFITWWQKRYPVTVTDDLARTFTIYITNFAATRKRASRHPWKHDYTMSYFILDWL